MEIPMGIILFGNSKIENIFSWDKDGEENRSKKSLK
jgi:hypothetical protein